MILDNYESKNTGIKHETKQNLKNLSHEQLKKFVHKYVHTFPLACITESLKNHFCTLVFSF